MYNKIGTPNSQQIISRKQSNTNQIKQGPKSIQSNQSHEQQQSEKSVYSQQSSNIFLEEPSGSERVQVCLRIRPMNIQEINRGDENCIKVFSEDKCEIQHKQQIKQFRFNRVLQQNSTQSQVFNDTKIQSLLDSALNGYSATIFAYGQTGSGKTYSMFGVDDKDSNFDGSTIDIRDGIIPNSFQYLWSKMNQRQEQYYVKASFTEIYNEQLRDLLNPVSGVLHTRWNIKNGFFVEDLMIVECTNVDDLLAVLQEGMKNRKSGSHELNKDSSRSHSIMTIYLISEVQTEQQLVKRYGKLSFVDLAGSERLKESKSQGEMVKETGQINKSLFTLGKVISGLSSKNKQDFIPYRDSKLTMLLMDSLGGKSKALMIACVSPSSVYFDETLSTMNYAQRTMNIKNQPIVQMDPKDQIILNLSQELKIVKMENLYLKEQIQRVTNGMPLEMPDFYSHQKQRNLPPLQSASKKISNSQQLLLNEDKNIDVNINKIINEYQIELNRIKNENVELRNARQHSEKQYHIVMNENNSLSIKLQNLEHIFIGNPIQRDNNQQKIQDDYMTSTIILENKELKQRIADLEEKNMQLTHMIKEQAGLNLNQKEQVEDLNQVLRLKQQNNEMQQRIEFLQKRESDRLKQ